jgi:AsmA protein
LSINLPGGGSAKVSGKAGPINAQDAAKTPVNASVKVKDLDIAGSGLVDQASGMGGSVDFESTLTSNGKEGKRWSLRLEVVEHSG